MNLILTELAQELTDARIPVKITELGEVNLFQLIDFVLPTTLISVSLGLSELYCDIL
jgi:hypothetical protein